jgi:hypothetical protein
MRSKIILIVVIIILAVGILYFVKNFTNNNSIIVGGDKDIHGCIGSAGYSWCEVKDKCLRVWEEKCEATSPNTQNIQSCAQKNGVWYPSENICEVNQLSASECKAKGGEFNECASACRHDPKAEVCTMQCVLTCTFR